MLKSKAFALFCDDIRQEISNKVSLIGIYGSHMLVSEMPAKLPKLCVHFQIELEPKEVPQKIQIFVKCDDNVINDINFHHVVQGSSVELVSGGFDIPFLEIEKPLTLSVHLFIDGTTEELTKLIVDKMPLV